MDKITYEIIEQIDGFTPYFKIGHQSFVCALSQETEEMAQWYIDNLKKAFTNIKEIK